MVSPVTIRALAVRTSQQQHGRRATQRELAQATLTAWAARRLLRWPACPRLVAAVAPCPSR
jgi:hypothetical protein